MNNQMNHLCQVAGVAGEYFDIDSIFYVLDSTPHILKLAIGKYVPSPNSRRVFVYHSWRAVIKGVDAPLDDNEISSFRNSCPVDLFLVGNESHIKTIHRLLNKPAIVLPYTLFLPNPPFCHQNCDQDFDVVFFCMFSDEQIYRKNAALFLDILRYDRSLKGLWIGDYSPYERWAMEHAFNQFAVNNPYPPEWDPAWTEKERSFSWYHGSNLLPFGNEDKRIELFMHYDRIAREEKLNLTMYRGLSRNQVVHALNRSTCVILLSVNDQWPRATTEALACGVPVVAADHLLSGKQILHPENSIVVAKDTKCIAHAIKETRKFNRQEISDDFHKKYGLINCSRKVIKAINELGIEWADIVDWQRPAEKIFKHETRENMLCQ